MLEFPPLKYTASSFFFSPKESEVHTLIKSPEYIAIKNATDSLISSLGGAGEAVFNSVPHNSQLEKLTFSIFNNESSLTSHTDKNVVAVLNDKSLIKHFTTLKLIFTSVVSWSCWFTIECILNLVYFMSNQMLCWYCAKFLLFLHQQTNNNAGLHVLGLKFAQWYYFTCALYSIGAKQSLTSFDFIHKLCWYFHCSIKLKFGPLSGIFMSKCYQFYELYKKHLMIHS